ncbi:MAG: nuclear transport factor 2 family protein [Planctomycetota bacterium]
MHPKLANATSLYLDGIRDGNARKAVTRYTGDRYTQHSTGVRNGVEGFVEFFEPFFERCPVRDIRIVRSIVDGPYVFVQAFQDINDGQARWVTTDLFDTDADDKIVEHWDVISAYETSADSSADQIGGPTEIADEASTEPNKQRVRDFLCDVMVLGRGDRLDRFVNGDALITRKASDVAALDELIGAYDLVFKIVGQGNSVAAYSRVLIGDAAYARFDLFRLSDGLIVEHWINQEVIPPKADWANGGKF